MSHINKIETMQAKILRTKVNVPWYVRNEDIRRILGIPTVKEAISSYAERYKARIGTHPNSGNDQHFKYGRKAEKETPSRPHKGYNLANARMVLRWG